MFSPKTNQTPLSNHSRSQTLPQVYHNTDSNQLQPESAQESLYNRPADSIGGPSPGHRLTEPRRSHQRTFTESSRSNVSLPPLLKPQNKQIDQYCPDRNSFHSGFTQQQLTPTNLQQSRQSSPSRSHAGTDSTKPDGAANKIASWFQGESEPLKVGFVPVPALTKETTDQEDMSAFPTSRPTGLLQRKSTSMITPSPPTKPGMASRFSFFSSKASLVKPDLAPIDPAEDEILSMTPATALIPSGTADPFSPSAFKNLQQQAEGLLTKVQAAYRERTQTLREMTAEKEALAEETQGAETRAEHLKLQLDTMAAKLAEQDEVMMNLVDELAREKLARQEEEEARKRTLRLVSNEQPTAPLRARYARGSLANTISDSGCESEDDSSSAESIFSKRERMHSPTMSMSSVSTNNSPEIYQTPGFPPLSSHPPGHRSSQVSTLPNNNKNIRSLPLHQSCANCSVLQSSEAWGIVGTLKEENEALKHRVGELESTLDGCLDVVSQLSG